ncbi:MAG: hypothetical protein AAFR11_12855 [Pseudomonadota bacterium]
MAITYINDDRIGPSARIDATTNPEIGDGDMLWIGEDATILATGADAVRFVGIEELDIAVDGDVFGMNIGLLMSFNDVNEATSTRHSLTLSETGSVRSEDRFAARLKGAGEDKDTRAIVSNAGEISTNATGEAALEMSDYARVLVDNSGLIASDTFTFGRALRIDGPNITLQNRGDIVMTSTAPISVDTLQQATGYAAVELTTTSNDPSAFEVNNSGLISGTFAALAIEGAGAEISNSGMIDGDIFTDDFDVALTNSGTIDGRVSFGAGDDLIDGFGGLITGRIDAGDGNDVIRSGYGNDVIDGGDGGDLINGGLGEDWAEYVNSFEGVALDFRSGVGFGQGGHAAGDTVLNVENIRGSDFADAFKGDVNANILEGGGGNDDLRGFGGDDTLDGGAGNDVLFGFADDDILDGGAGADVMVGGDGRDVFRFDDGDTGRGAQSDRINDFGADDILDLSGIDAIAGGDDNSFDLVQFFTGAGGEARFLTNGAGEVVLQYDIDGDQVPDGAIIFANGYMPEIDQLVL